MADTRVAQRSSPARRLGVHAGGLGRDVGRLGAKSNGHTGRGGWSVVDLDSCVGRPRLCGIAVRPGRGTRPASPIVAVAGQLVVVSVVLLGPLVFAMTVAGIAVLLGEPWAAARPPAFTLSIPALG